MLLLVLGQLGLFLVFNLKTTTLVYVEYTVNLTNMPPWASVEYFNDWLVDFH